MLKSLRLHQGDNRMDLLLCGSKSAGMLNKLHLTLIEYIVVAK